mmetsp:Transcript_64199/g.137878  ORF Transcript_64199/g.137878 Transcript_64199/m.137878 type:complete len:206 (+) Transcript_64199:115-732(+)
MPLGYPLTAQEDSKFRCFENALGGCTGLPGLPLPKPFCPNCGPSAEDLADPTGGRSVPTVRVATCFLTMMGVLFGPGAGSPLSSSESSITSSDSSFPSSASSSASSFSSGSISSGSGCFRIARCCALNASARAENSAPRDPPDGFSTTRGIWRSSSTTSSEFSGAASSFCGGASGASGASGTTAASSFVSSSASFGGASTAASAS